MKCVPSLQTPCKALHGPSVRLAAAMRVSAEKAHARSNEPSAPVRRSTQQSSILAATSPGQMSLCVLRGDTRYVSLWTHECIDAQKLFRRPADGKQRYVWISFHSRSPCVFTHFPISISVFTNVAYSNVMRCVACIYTDYINVMYETGHAVQRRRDGEDGWCLPLSHPPFTGDLFTSTLVHNPPVIL